MSGRIAAALLAALLIAFVGGLLWGLILAGVISAHTREASGVPHFAPVHVPAAASSQPTPSGASMPGPILEPAPSRSLPPRPTPEQPAELVTPRPVVVTKGGSSVVAAKTWAVSVIGSAQASCLFSLVAVESGWNVRATNATSGAYGLPQALPGSKMAAYGADWRTNATTQLRFMVAYVAGRYGSACGAWGFWQRSRWY